MTPLQPAAKSEPSTHGVWIPFPLAHAVLECYYGGGRRFREPAPSPIPEAVTPPTTPARDAPGQGPLFNDLHVHTAIPPGFKPMGIAAHKRAPTTAPATIPPGGTAT